MELRDALAALRAAWWLTLIGLVLGGAGALLLSVLQTPLYTSSTQLFVSTRDTASTSEAFEGGRFSQERVASYARLIGGDELARRIVDRLQLTELPRSLSERVTATAVVDTVLIDVTVTDESPEQAQRIAEAVGEEFTNFVTELETPARGGASPVTVTISDQPEAAIEPSSPQTTRNIAFGLLLGLLVGAGLAILRARLDRSVKSAETASDLTGAPVIGTVLREQGLEKGHTIDRRIPNRTVEDYRQLRNNLQFLSVDEPPKVIMVSSALPSEGKTTTVINLALALVDAGQAVTIVEADLRRPKVTRYLGLIGGVGLTNLLAGTADLDEVVQKYGDGDLQVVAAGPTPPNPGELLASSHMAALLDKLRGRSDFVLVDAPPLLPVADSSGLAVHTDGVLLSVRYGSTRRDQLAQAAATLDRVGAKTLGVILNIVPPRADLAVARGYGYGYETGKHA